jgi:hypothetical protein
MNKIQNLIIIRIINCLLPILFNTLRNTEYKMTVLHTIQLNVRIPKIIISKIVLEDYFLFYQSVCWLISFLCQCLVVLFVDDFHVNFSTLKLKLELYVRSCISSIYWFLSFVKLVVNEWVWFNCDFLIPRGYC